MMMKKMLRLFGIIALLTLVLAGCMEIAPTPINIPADPSPAANVVEWGTVLNGKLFASFDKLPFLTPLSLKSDFKKIKISTTEKDLNLEKSIIHLFEGTVEKGFVLNKESTVRNVLDISIILDTTGSMGGAINGAKDSIINFAQSLKDSGLDAKIGIIPFDDYAPAQDMTDVDPKWLDLASPEEAQAYTTKLYAAGGGDGPENPYDALMYSWDNMSWRKGSQRIFIVITDINAHYKGDGTSYTSLLKSDLLAKMGGYATIHSVFVSNYRHSGDVPYSAPDDIRELSYKTGGIILYTSSGSVDLTTLGVKEYVLNSYVLIYKPGDPSLPVKVYIKDMQGREGSVPVVKFE